MTPDIEGMVAALRALEARAIETGYFPDIYLVGESDPA